MTTHITHARLIALIEAYGADPQAFPKSERDAAAALLAESPERFMQALEVAGDLDGLLAGLQPEQPSSSLSAALIASAPAPRETVRRRRFLPDWPTWAPVSAAASLACGLIMGLMVAPATADITDTTTVAVDMAFGADWLDYSEDAPE